jgi:hypothetical protein
MISHLDGEFRGRLYSVRPGHPAAEGRSAELPGGAVYTVEYGDGLTMLVLGPGHEAAPELRARVERLLERVSRSAVGSR